MASQAYKASDENFRLDVFLSSRKVSLNKLQELVGHLNFACRVVAPGRTFLSSFSDAMGGLSKVYHKCYVMAEISEDARVWKLLLNNFNG